MTYIELRNKREEGLEHLRKVGVKQRATQRVHQRKRTKQSRTLPGSAAARYPLLDPGLAGKAPFALGS